MKKSLIIMLLVSIFTIGCSQKDYPEKVELVALPISYSPVFTDQKIIKKLYNMLEENEFTLYEGEVSYYYTIIFTNPNYHFIISSDGIIYKKISDNIYITDSIADYNYIYQLGWNDNG